MQEKLENIINGHFPRLLIVFGMYEYKKPCTILKIGLSKIALSYIKMLVKKHPIHIKSCNNILLNGKSRYFPTLFKMGTKPLWRSIRLIKLPCFLKRFFVLFYKFTIETNQNKLHVIYLWWLCITFVWPSGSKKLATAAPSTDQNAIWRYFTLLRLCPALLFFISIKKL